MMNKHVIHIFGASGAGTSTLGRFLCEKNGFFHMDTDDYYWEKADPPYTMKRDPRERIATMRNDVQSHENVVISGSLTGWGDELMPLFTLAVRLKTDTAVRMERLKKRERDHFGARLEPGGDMHASHLEFLDWAASYDTGGVDMRSRACHDEWQKRLQCPLLVLDGALPLEENCAAVMRGVRESMEG